ncbi:hypothetical protein [Sphingomonas sp. 3P27F8]|uniref:hypothetical protein n=1 Tax=Sphingomonas sp. 3P27F8 TaxID=2502213 RepID=UPI0010F5E614|nr:hypothetical protein [Sphingomonas sp. 3P27F8]
MIFTYTQFKPARLFEITGMTPDLQQLWRRRGQLPWGNGKPRPITAIEAAEIFLRYQLSQVGVPPSESAEIGQVNAPIVLWYALLEVDGACAVRGPLNRVDEFLEEFRMTHKVATDLTGIHQDTSYRFLYRFNGEQEFTASFALPEIGPHSPFATLNVIDLHGIGSLLASRAESPLILVEIADSTVPRSEWVTKFTGPRT